MKLRARMDSLGTSLACVLETLTKPMAAQILEPVTVRELKAHKESLSELGYRPPEPIKVSFPELMRGAILSVLASGETPNYENVASIAHLRIIELWGGETAAFVRVATGSKATNPHEFSVYEYLAKQAADYLGETYIEELEIVEPEPEPEPEPQMLEIIDIETGQSEFEPIPLPVQEQTETAQETQREIVVTSID